MAILVPGGDTFGELSAPRNREPLAKKELKFYLPDKESMIWVKIKMPL
jgi:hypothetical protein